MMEGREEVRWGACFEDVGVRVITVCGADVEEIVDVVLLYVRVTMGMASVRMGRAAAARVRIEEVRRAGSTGITFSAQKHVSIGAA
jgi:hypothetical protein